MKKFLSLAAALFIAFAANADPVVLPATLDVNNVSFRSEGMPDFVLTEGDYAGTYFDMGAHDDAADTLLYAEWDVTIQPIQYNVAVDVYNPNGWSLGLVLVNQAGDTLKSIRYAGGWGKSGQFAIGSLDLSDLAAGDYKVRVNATTAWSQMKLKDVIFVANYAGVSVALPGALQPAYAQLSAGASVTSDAIAFAPSTANNEYAIWNVSFAEAGTYDVSIDITASNGHNYGVALLSADGASQIEAVNEGGQNAETGVKELGAITVPAAGNYVVKLTNATQWSEAVLNSITFAGAAAPAVSNYYIKGTMNNWQLDENYKMTPNEAADDVEYMLDITLAEGDEFKVFEDDGSENGQWHPGAANYVVDAAHAGDVTIYFRPNGKQGDDAWYYTVIYVAVHTPEVPEAQWEEIVFTEVAAKGSLNGAVFAAASNENFTLTVTDTDANKIAVDENTARFGTEEAYKDYSFRLKTGGKSSAKNVLTLAIPAAGTLRIAARTGSNSDATRTLVITQGETELYNQVVKEDDKTVVESGESSTNYYPYIEVTVAAGQVVLGYPVNGLNFYAFGFKAAQTGTGIDNTQVMDKAVKVIENGQLIIIKNGIRYNVMGTIVK